MRGFAIVILLCFTVAAHSADPPRPAAVAAGNTNNWSGAGDSFMPLLSANDRHVVFLSYAHNLVTNDNLARHLDVFVYDLETLTNVYPYQYPYLHSNKMATLVSVNRDGTGGGDGDSAFPSISSNGQWIAFASAAGNLVDDDNNNASDVFVRDVVARTTTLVSVDLSGQSPPDPVPTSSRLLSSNPQISHDGRWIAFDSRAANLVSLEDTNGASDVFIRDMQLGVTRLVSVDATGTQAGNGRSELPKITPDGRYVVFVSTATNLTIPGPTTNAAGGKIYVRDLQLGVTHWISTNDGGFFGNPAENSGHHNISDDGQSVVFIDGWYVMFYSVASNTLIRIGSGPPRGVGPQISGDGRMVAYAGNTNLLDPSKQYLYVWNRGSRSNVFVSYAALGFALARSGNSICFLSDFNEPATNDFGPRVETRLYHRDLASGVTRLIPGASGGNLDLKPPAISSGGEIVAFDSRAGGADDFNNASDVFLRNVAVENTYLVSHRARSLPSRTALGRSRLWSQSVSSNGTVIAFTTVDSDLIPADTNKAADLFIRDLTGGTIVHGKAHPPLPPSGATAAEPVVSGDGRFVAFNWRFNILRDLSSQQQLYLFDRQSNTSSLAGVTMIGATLNSIGPPSINFEGRLVAFASDRNSGEVANVSDGNSGLDVFVRDIILRTNYLISANSTGFRSGNGASSNGVISPNGRWVLFQSAATDIVALPQPPGGVMGTNLPPGLLYARDLLSTNISATQIASLSSNNFVPVRGPPVFSGNSEWIGYVTRSPLIAAANQIYVRDLLSTTRRFVCATCDQPALDANATFVAYATLPNSGQPQIFVKNMLTGVDKLISANLRGNEGNGQSTSPSITPNGRFVVFQSRASDLIKNDGNGASDIFIADRVLGARVLLSGNKDGTGAGNGPSSFPVLSADGRAVVFQSFANDLVDHDYNDTRDIFVVRLSQPDFDNDGMDDDFEVTYFGSLNRDGSGDFDGDGQTDAEEFRAGTNPADDDSILRVLTLSLAEGGAKTVLWSAAPGRAYRVQFKDDLNANWSDLPGQVIATSSTAAKSDTESAAHRFYRVLLAE